MGDDTTNSAVATASVVSGNTSNQEERLAQIEARLKQISGYRFIPPSIKREKEELEKQKAAILQSGKVKVEGGGNNVQGNQTPHPHPSLKLRMASNPLPPHPTSPRAGEELLPDERGEGARGEPPKPVDNFGVPPVLQNPPTESLAPTPVPAPARHVDNLSNNQSQQNNPASPSVPPVQPVNPSPQIGSEVAQQQEARGGDKMLEFWDKPKVAPVPAPAPKQPTGDKLADDWFEFVNNQGAKGEDGDKDVPKIDIDSDLQAIASQSLEKGASADKKSADDIIGIDYASPHESDDEVIGAAKHATDIGLMKPQFEDIKESGKSSDEPKEFDLKKKMNRLVTLDEVAKMVEALTNTCRVTLKNDMGHPDAEYLEKVIAEFDDTVAKIIQRARAMEMSEAWKAKAVQGRLTGYIKALKADFDFSDMLKHEIEAKMDELMG